MKTLYTLLFTLLFAATLHATTITAVVNNGKWNANGTWNLNRKPQANDSIRIPAGINVVLDNSFSLNNIYIEIAGTLTFQGGQLTLNSTSSILITTGGKIVGTSNDEQIKLGNIHKYKGGEGTLYGPKLANALSGNGFISLTLPVKFTGFYAKKIGAKNELTWITSEEINNSHFDVQRSDDGHNWSNIAVVFAVSNPGPVNRYSYNDAYSNAGKVYYRLKQVDNDGRYAYSSIRIIYGNEQTPTANIYSPAKKTVVVEFNEQVKGKIIVRITNINGQTVREQQFMQSANRIEVYLENAVAGVYAVQVFSEQNKREVKKVVL